jgi:hypothetical protein
MIKLVSVALACLWMALPPSSVSPQSGSKELNAHQAIQARFLGGWRLISLHEPGRDGQVRRVDCTGMLIYTADGHMSVQVMYRNSQSAANAAPVQYAEGGYEASFGTYRVNDDHSFTFHVEGALVRSLIGKDLPRAYEFAGKQLIVRSTDSKEHWRVVWEHF